MDFIMPIVRNAAFALLLSSASVLSASAQTPVPDAVAAPGEAIVLTLHAEGAQIYECKAGADGKLAWAFREPTAALLLVGKAVGNAPGATANDIPWLKLTVTSGRGTGILSGVTTVQRINTVGGKLEGECEKLGTYRNAPYSADYVFLRKG